ncbi:hypothetical protein HK100_001325 [Physocladia obscura]|uniref:Uncharacterized protein n=1 Tax=Physocladia obscura TaxID=109957 RepID=A0AAD5XBX1_9FUNG|nr:hypothetical protein HK100_001325 [Physocladia obscura]
MNNNNNNINKDVPEVVDIDGEKNNHINKEVTEDGGGVNKVKTGSKLSTSQYIDQIMQFKIKCGNCHIYLLCHVTGSCSCSVDSEVDTATSANVVIQTSQVTAFIGQNNRLCKFKLMYCRKSFGNRKAGSKGHVAFKRHSPPSQAFAITETGGNISKDEDDNNDSTTETDKPKNLISTVVTIPTSIGK